MHEGCPGGFPGLRNLAGPVQHDKSAILSAWRSGFRGGPLLDISGSHLLLNSTRVRERDKALLRGVMVGGAWNFSYLARLVVKLFLVVFVLVLMVMVICFGNVLSSSC